MPLVIARRNDGADQRPPLAPRRATKPLPEPLEQPRVASQQAGLDERREDRGVFQRQCAGFVGCPQAETQLQARIADVARQVLGQLRGAVAARPA